VPKGGVYETDEENSRGSGGPVHAFHSRRDQSSRLSQWGRAFRRRWTYCLGDCRGVDAQLRLGATGSQGRRAHKASYETIPSPNGNGYVRGYLVRPFSADSRSETPTKLPGILVIHENRGLNPHTEEVARRFALENFMAFAPDALSSVGGYPGDDYKGGQLFAKIDGAKRTQDFVTAAMWLKSRADCTGQIGATGFCFGGGMANRLAVLLGPDLAAAAPFYGGAPPPEDVPKIKAAILIHHGALDKTLSEGWPAQEAELKKNNIRYEGHIYPNSVHGFFNDATPERYNKVTAQQAWTRTIEWFNQYVRAA
jgi:carboxymethylenebutenolidase